MKLELEQIEQLIAKQEPTLRKKAQTALQTAVVILPTIVLMLIPLSKGARTLGIIAWAFLLLSLWLLTLWCGSRARARELQALLAKEPELPDLDGLDNRLLIHLVINHLGRYADRISGEMEVDTYKIIRSLDKLEAHNYVEKKLNVHSGLYEYAASAHGRSRMDQRKTS